MNSDWFKISNLTNVDRKACKESWPKSKLQNQNKEYSKLKEVNNHTEFRKKENSQV